MAAGVVIDFKVIASDIHPSSEMSVVRRMTSIGSGKKEDVPVMPFLPFLQYQIHRPLSHLKGLDGSHRWAGRIQIDEAEAIL